VAGALQLGEGWMHIHGKASLQSALTLSDATRDIDERNIPPLNRIGDPDDILACVRVESGKVGVS
jgi:hypothetical protein